MKPAFGIVNFRLISALILGISVLLVLSTLLSWYHTREFENDLNSALQERLKAAGFDSAEVTIDGRSIIFTGEVDAQTDRQKMLDIASSIPGVESVRDERVVTNYAVGRHFELHSFAGITTVEGELPSASDIDLIVSSIHDFYGVEPLGTDLKVNRAVQRPPWIDDFIEILGVVSVVSPLKLEYLDGAFHVSRGRRKS